MGRQAVQEDRLGVGELHQLRVHRVALERVAPRLGFGLLPHRRPHVRVDDVRALRRLLGHLGHDDLRLFLGALELVAARLEPLGARQPQLEAQHLRRLEPAVRHVVAVPHPRDALPLPPAEVLSDGEQVSQHLTRVSEISQPVDDRHRRPARQLLDLLVVEGADHDAVHVARQHPGGVRNRFSAPQLDVFGRKEQRLPPELRGPDLKGDPRARAGLGEHHRQRLPRQRRLPVAAVLHLGREVEQLGDLVAGEVGDGQKVPFGHEFPGGRSK